MRRSRPITAVTLVTVGMIAACDVSPDGTVPEPEPSVADPSAVAWEPPDDYAFVLRSRCGERADLGRYEIVVQDGAVTDVHAPHWERLGHDLASIGFESGYIGEAPTLLELVDEAEAAEAAGAEVVELTVDAVDGRPMRLDIDWDEGAVDDEACFIVSDYEPDAEGHRSDQSPDAAPFASVPTPDGEARVQLQVTPARIEPHEDVSIRLLNHGEVELVTGVDFTIERWEDGRWVDPFTPDAPAVGLVLAPGGGHTGRDVAGWPGQFRGGAPPLPGTYRVTKTATYEAATGPTEIVVDALVEVVP